MRSQGSLGKISYHSYRFLDKLKNCTEISFSGPMPFVREAASEKLHTPQVTVLVLLGSSGQLKTFGVLEPTVQLYGH